MNINQFGNCQPGAWKHVPVTFSLGSNGWCNSNNIRIFAIVTEVSGMDTSSFVGGFLDRRPVRRVVLCMDRFMRGLVVFVTSH